MVHGVALSVVSALYDVIASVVTRVKNVILPLQITVMLQILTFQNILTYLGINQVDIPHT